MARLTKLEDNVLVKRVREDGDQFAFGALMEKYRKAIFFTILKMVNNREDADDLTLECFTKAYKNIHKYNDSFAFSTWIFKIASNGAIDFIRKKRIQTTSIDRTIGGEDGEGGTSLANMLSDDKLDPEEEIIRTQRSDKLQDLVASMDPKYGELIKLRHFEELKYDEIVERTGLPIGTVKVRLSRAKKLLASMLDDRRFII